MNIDGPSFVLGVVFALPAYWATDTWIVPRVAHLLYLTRRRERV